MVEVVKARRGRPATGQAKSSTERGKAADEALVASGGVILNRVRLSPEAARALDRLVALDGSQREAIQNALIQAVQKLE
jgi:hypothetical protein